MANNQLLPFGTAGGANVLDFASYQNLPARLTGFTAGTAISQQLNTAWRQSSFGVAMIGQFTADYSSANVNDDGDVATFEKNFVSALGTIALRRTRVVISATGAYSWTNTTGGPISVLIRAWGAGGGGGFATSASGAAGGGAGAYLEKVVTIPAGGTITGSIGAGGSGGTSGVNGGSGGSTTVTVAGTTYTAGGGTGAANTNASSAGNSVSGGAVTGTVDISRAGAVSGGGVQGYSGSGILYYGGEGGAAPNGGDGGKRGTAAGNPGATPGGGGGGAGANGSNQNGGAGARGEVWIEYAA